MGQGARGGEQGAEDRIVERLSESLLIKLLTNNQINQMTRGTK